MATLAFIKTLHGLKPYDDATAKWWHGLAVGEVVSFNWRKPRSLAYHRKWWAMVRLVHEATGKWPSAEVLHDLVCIAIGHCDTYLMASGALYYKPRTISFAGMDDAEFHAFYNRGLDALCELAGDIESTALREAVLGELSR